MLRKVFNLNSQWARWLIYNGYKAPNTDKVILLLGNFFRLCNEHNIFSQQKCLLKTMPLSSIRSMINWSRPNYISGLLNPAEITLDYDIRAVSADITIYHYINPHSAVASRLGDPGPRKIIIKLRKIVPHSLEWG